MDAKEIVEKENMLPGINWMASIILDGNYGIFDEKNKIRHMIPHPPGKKLILENKPKPAKWIDCDSEATRNTLVALVERFKEMEEKYYEIKREQKAREKSERVSKMTPAAKTFTDDEIEGLIDEWQDDAGMHSFKHTMLAGAAFEELLAVDKDRMIPFLLRRLRDESISMAYQGFLQDLAGEDLGKWTNPTPGIRAYNVKESAKIWLKWGLEKGLIDHANVKYGNGGQAMGGMKRGLCYKCRKKKMVHELKPSEGFPKMEGSTRICETSCPDCGVLIRSLQTMSSSGNSEATVRLWRGKTTPEISRW